MRATDDWFNPLPPARDQVQAGPAPIRGAVVDGPLSLNAGQATFTVRLATGGYQLLTAAT